MTRKGTSLPTRYFIFIVVLITCGQVSTSFAAVPECKKSLVLSTTSNWYPYIYKADDQEYKGVDLQLLKDVLKEMGCDVVVAQYPERRSLFEISQGRFDIGLGASKNKERLKQHHYSNAYRHEVNRFAYRINNSDIEQTSSLQDIIKLEKVIAINLAGWYGYEIEKAKANYNNFIFSDSITKRLKMLYHERVDIVIDDEIVLCYELERSIFNGMAIHPQVLYDTPIHFIFNKKNISPEFVQQFNLILEQMRIDGRLMNHFNASATSRCLA